MLIGTLLITGSAGLVGLRPVILLGRRLELPVSCTRSEPVIESIMTAVSCAGSVIKLIPILPIGLLARSLPRCGVQINTTRLIRGLARNVVERTIKLSLEFSLKIFLAVCPRLLSHIASVTVTTWL